MKLTWRCEACSKKTILTIYIKIPCLNLLFKCKSVNHFKMVIFFWSVCKNNFPISFRLTKFSFSFWDLEIFWQKFSFATVLLATRSKCVSEYFKKIVKNHKKNWMIIRVGWLTGYHRDYLLAFLNQFLKNLSEYCASVGLYIIEPEKYLSPRNLKWKFCETKICKKNRKNYFCIRFRTLRIFWNRKKLISFDEISAFVI